MRATAPAVSTTEARLSAGGVLAAAALVAALALGVRAPTPWTGLGFVGAWLAFFLAGSALLPLPRGAAPARGGWLEPLRFVVVALVAGLASAVVLWSVSAFTVKSLGAGTIAVALLAGAGALRLARSRPALGGAVSGVPVCAAAAAFALAWHVLGTNEVLHGKRLAFTFRWDWPVHLYWASLIRELGLPLVDPTGRPGVRYASLYHTGVLVAAGGIEQLTATSLYQAARILGAGAFVVIALAGACLTARLGLPAWQTVLCAVAPLVWASLSAPVDLLRGNWPGVLDAYGRSWPRYAAVAGSMYHNLPQLGAILVGAGALVALDRHRERREPADLVLAGLLLGLSTAFKPSVVVVYAPAVLLVLTFGGAPRRSVVVFLGAVALGSVVYFLPALVAHLPPGVGWSVRPAALLARERWLDVAVLGVVLVLVAARAVQVVRSPLARSWTVLDVLLVATGGGVLFAALFVEGARRVGHGNHTWSRAAALTLLAPLATGLVLRFADRFGVRPREHPVRAAAAALAVALIALHLAAGTLYALRYPAMRPAFVRVNAAAALRIASAATERGARLVADGSIGRGPQLPYLARRSAFTADGPVQLVRGVLRWPARQGRRARGAVAVPLAGRDAAVLAARSRAVRPRLEEAGWSLRLRSGPYEVWVAGKEAAGGATARQPSGAMSSTTIAPLGAHAPTTRTSRPVSAPERSSAAGAPSATSGRRPASPGTLSAK